jgi:hypothetical protein
VLRRLGVARQFEALDRAFTTLSRVAKHDVGPPAGFLQAKGRSRIFPLSSVRFTT